jgi:hypothetical protein
MSASPARSGLSMRGSSASSCWRWHPWLRRISPSSHAWPRAEAQDSMGYDPSRRSGGPRPLKPSHAGSITDYQSDTFGLGHGRKAARRFAASRLPQPAGLSPSRRLAPTTWPRATQRPLFMRGQFGCEFNRNLAVGPADAVDLKSRATSKADLLYGRRGRRRAVRGGRPQVPLSTGGWWRGA